VSHFIEEEEEDPVKIDSPTRSRPTQIPTPTLVQESPKSKLAPPETFTSPQANKTLPRPSPEKKKNEEITKPKETTPIETKPLATKSIETNTQQLVIETPVPQAQPVKIGSKRKLAARDDMVTSRPSRTNNENENPRAAVENPAIGEKAGGRAVKELTGIRKDVRDKVNATGARKPLAAKSTNGDMTSPKKISKPVAIDEVAAAKADLVRSKTSQDRPKSKSKSLAPITIETVLAPQPSAPGVVEMPSNLGTPFTDPALLSPNSPDSAAPVDTGRGGTPPPGDVNASREPSRPSRRNRTAVSYAEPNLRDKMRRPTKDMLDAVAGEGKYARRSSVAEQAPDTARVKRESGAEELWKKLPIADGTNAEHEPGSIPASPLAGKGSPADCSKTLSIRSGRRTSMMIHEIVTSSEISHEDGDVKDETASDTTGLSEVDVYEFTPSSPQTEDQVAAAEIKKKTAGRRPSRRVSSAVHSEEGPGARERASSRRRSMML
jgi:hypothetical protein